jgi:hypothetical protein
MARVDDWFARFVTRHVQRFPRPDWPDEASEFWISLKRMFVRNAVSEREADAASEALVESPPAHLDRHAPDLIAKVRESWKASRQGADPADPQALKAESRGCEHCGGAGSATVFRPTPRPSCPRCGGPLPPDHLACPKCEPRARRVPRTVAAHCVCPYGRWVRSRLAASDPDVCRRCPDLDDVLAGRSLWLAEDPEVGPVPEGMTAETALAAIRDQIAARRAEALGPRRRAPEPGPLSEAESAFAAKLSPDRAARFASLDPENRALVMRAVKDPTLRPHAVGLIGPAPERDPPAV